MNWAKFFTVVLIATIKTLFAPPIGFAANLSFGMTFLAVLIGGCSGFVFFFYFFDLLMKKINKKLSDVRRAKKICQARKIITLKQRYPLWIFLFILPLFSIPVMSFIIRKFYCHDRMIFFSSLGVIAIWSFGMCLIYSPILKFF